MAIHIFQRIRENRLVLLIALTMLAIETSAVAAETLATARNFQAENWANSARRSYQPITAGIIEANVRKVLETIQVAKSVLEGMPNGGVLIRETKLNQLQSDLTLRIYDVERLKSVLGFMSRSMPKEAEKDTQLQYALKLIRGEVVAPPAKAADAVTAETMKPQAAPSDKPEEKKQ